MPHSPSPRPRKTQVTGVTLCQQVPWTQGDVNTTLNGVQWMSQGHANTRQISPYLGTPKSHDDGGFKPTQTPSAKCCWVRAQRSREEHGEWGIVLSSIQDDQRCKTKGKTLVFQILAHRRILLPRFWRPNGQTGLSCSFSGGLIVTYRWEVTIQESAGCF